MDSVTVTFTDTFSILIPKISFYKMENKFKKLPYNLLSCVFENRKPRLAKINELKRKENPPNTKNQKNS
jgi:hypothetical protein